MVHGTYSWFAIAHADEQLSLLDTGRRLEVARLGIGGIKRLFGENAEIYFADTSLFSRPRSWTVTLPNCSAKCAGFIAAELLTAPKWKKCGMGYAGHADDYSPETRMQVTDAFVVPKLRGDSSLTHSYR